MNNLMERAKQNKIAEGYQRLANYESTKLWCQGKELTEGNPMTRSEHREYLKEIGRRYLESKLNEK